MFKKVSELLNGDEIIYFDGMLYNKGIVERVSEDEIHLISGHIIVEFDSEIEFWMVNANTKKVFGYDLNVGDNVLIEDQFHIVSEMGYQMQEFGMIDVLLDSSIRKIIYFDYQYIIRVSE